MAITKEIKDDKIEVVGDHKCLQIRSATIISEDGVELTRSFHRRVIYSVQSSKDGSSWTHTDTDVSGETPEIQAIATAAWTADAKTAQKAINEAGG
jgi:hypothetical protein|tara:strand:+ start:34 stop:321 length:288 start_codon:yes stop_codon:yes gene_type:complete